jgi:5-methyltetrahydropteroyltriglutamate--homocysteine methyltransferase
MQLSRDRILTTHVGSLPRNDTLTDLLIRREAGEAIDKARLDAEMDKAVREVVEKQKAAGIDIGNDGEQQRVGFQTYVPTRMSGYAGESKRKVGKDFAETPELVEQFIRRFPKRGKISNAPQAQGEVKYHDLSQIRDEIARFRRCAPKGTFLEEFATAPSPGIVATTLQNVFYDSHEKYVDALARELRHEYLAIHEAGLILQIDAPDLAMERTMTFQDLSESEFVKVCDLHLHAINKAVEGIPRDRWRLHVCWGNWEGPHEHDVPLGSILSILYKTTASALSIEFANPRHAHEYEAIKKAGWPKDLILIPGVIESTSNFVEHPEVVARRIAEAVSVVGDRERVIASTDCGFGTFAGREWVAGSVVWKKLKSLREGADIASSRLWGKKSAA